MMQVEAASPVIGSIRLGRSIRQGDDGSVDLLATSSSPGSTSLVPMHQSSQENGTSCFTSPATQTLNHLSQTSNADLRYDMSQLEIDVAATLARASKSGDISIADLQSDDEDPEPTTTNRRSGTASSASRQESAKARRGGRCVGVHQIDGKTNKILGTFESIRRAEQATKVPRYQIAAVLAGQTKEAGGFFWRKEEQQTTASKDPSKQAKGRKDSTAPIELPLSLGNDFEIWKFTISAEGSLGIAVRRTDLSNRLRLALMSQDGAVSIRPDSDCCCVALFNNQGDLAKAAGLKIGDVFLKCCSETKTMVVESYDSVRDLARHGPRPISFLVARLKGDAADMGPKEQVEHANVHRTSQSTTGAHRGGLARETLTTTVAKAATSKLPKQTNSVKGLECKENLQTSSQSETQIVLADAPFCALCNGRTQKNPRAMHHSWCPKNQHFESSGSKEVYHRLKMGLSLSCAGCREEFQKGRAVDESLHSMACRRYREQREKDDSSVETTVERKAASTVRNKRKDPDHASPLTSRSKRLKHGNSAGARTTDRGSFPASFAHSEDSESSPIAGDNDGHCSDVSAYTESASKRRPIKKLTLVKEKVAPVRRGNKTNDSSKSKRAASKGKGSKSLEKPRRKTDHRTPAATEVGSKRQALVSNEKEELPKGSKAVFLDDWTDSDISDAEVVNTIWKDVPNPWGRGDFMEGDAVVSTNPPKRSHLEAMIFSRRFVVEPFSSAKKYRLTHVIPKDGFQALVLRRDPLATLHWGFTVYLHEFGGACLVRSVEDMSPASSATLLGVSADALAASKLQVHDMILAINGKSVGGMTVKALEMELEVCGPQLILLVSRYKMHSQAEEQLRQAEANYLDAIDKAINDHTHLGWIDLGAAARRDERQQNRNLGTDSQHQEACRVSETAGDHLKRMVESDVEVDEENAPMSERAAGLRPEDAFDRAVDQSHAAFTERKVENLLDNNVDDEFSACDVSNKRSEYEIGGQSGHGSDEESTPLPRGHRRRQKAYGPSPRASSSPKVSSGSPKHSAADDEDDGNAWFGCVCGVIHDKSIPVYWIQCEHCRSWYNVSADCVGFSMSEAETMKWRCWGCPEPSPSMRREGAIVESKEDLATGSPKKAGMVESLESPVASKTSSPSMQADTVKEELSASELTDLEERLRQMKGRLTKDGCILPASRPKKLPNGSFKRPTGPRPMLGPTQFEWDGKHGKWVPSHRKEMKCAEEWVTENDSVSHVARRMKDRLTKDGCIRPASHPLKLSDGTFKRPTGPRPKLGSRRAVWDGKRGLWVPSEKASRGAKDESNRRTSVSKPSRRKEMKSTNERVNDNGDSVSDAEMCVNRHMKDRLTRDSCVRPANHPVKPSDGTFKQPPGPRPKLGSGRAVWDGKRGLWVPSEKGSSAVEDENNRSRRNDTAQASRGKKTRRTSASVLEKGDHVFVKEHAWSGVNNPEGIATVLDSYHDEDGDLVYDIKYIIDRKIKRGVLAEYITRHEW